MLRDSLQKRLKQMEKENPSEHQYKQRFLKSLADGAHFVVSFLKGNAKQVPQIEHIIDNDTEDLYNLVERATDYLYNTECVFYNRDVYLTVKTVNQARIKNKLIQDERIEECLNALYKGAIRTFEEFYNTEIREAKNRISKDPEGYLEELKGIRESIEGDNFLGWANIENRLEALQNKYCHIIPKQVRDWLNIMARERSLKGNLRSATNQNFIKTYGIKTLLYSTETIANYLGLDPEKEKQKVIEMHMLLKK